MLFIPEFPWSDLHTLNLDWLLSVVANHERQIQDLEGGASPYDEAPLADGVADPGNVNQFARGNHRHPTDTTRASVTALQAVQDSVPGPSNGNPRMDGTANPGTYTYYSRADHVHPSDTSKLDKTGGVVTGVLDITPRRCYAALTSAGWYRIMSNAGSINAGTAFSVDININTSWSNTPNVSRKIKLNAVNGKFVFSDETSLVYNASNQVIDKIRCSQDSEKMYVDIHYLPNAANYVSVDISVHASPEMQGNIRTINLTSVDQSPSGETQLTEYTFTSKAFSGIIVDERTVTTDNNGYYRFQDFPRNGYLILSCVPTVSGDYYAIISGSTEQWVRVMQSNNSPLANTSVTLRTTLIHL